MLIIYYAEWESNPQPSCLQSDAFSLDHNGSKVGKSYCFNYDPAINNKRLNIIENYSKRGHVALWPTIPDLPYCTEHESRLMAALNPFRPRVHN